MTIRAAITCAALAACLAGGSLVLAREPDNQASVSAVQLLAETLAGDPGKEVNAQLYTFPAGSSTPWHIHPGAHEIAYVVAGTFTFQREGNESIELKTGEAEYLQPDIVHRGMNKSDKLVKLFVVRIKPKDKPLVQEVPPP
jgi:quercetin dioxygenase-like cupin family protein